MSFIECKCTKCGAIGESKLSISGKHVKQSCNSCGAYVKFYPQNDLPPLKDVRAWIWEYTGGDLAVIGVFKNATNFVNYEDYLGKFIQYWKIYLQCLKICGETK